MMNGVEHEINTRCNRRSEKYAVHWVTIAVLFVLGGWQPWRSVRGYVTSSV